MSMQDVQSETVPTPGSPEAHSLGCLCSPNQNRNGAGIHRPEFGVVFAVLSWCRIHGEVQALRSSEGEKLELTNQAG
jgi:hypothetical protein